MLARLSQAYPGLDPERIPNMPGWVLAPLIEHLPRLEARALHREIVANLAPYLRATDRRRLMRRLEYKAELRGTGATREPMVPVEHDPEKAKAWFEARGIKVV